jgi:thioredoxin-like negative regulator of GroEL
MRPVVDRLYEEYGEDVHFAVLDANEAGEIGEVTSSFKINAVPTFVFVNADGEEVARTIGTATEEQLSAEIEKIK